MALEPKITLTHDLTGKVALVTGASSGLGARFAEVLAIAGAKVAVAARRTDRLSALVSRIREQGGTAEAFALDVRAFDALAPTLDAVEKALGPLDILINNAGVNHSGRTTDETFETYDFVMETNVKSCFFLATALAKRLIARKAPGRIINIGSIGSTHVIKGSAAYSISKAAIHMMTRCMADEWARHDINVNTLAPGYIMTELTDDWFETEGGKKMIQSWPRRRLQPMESLDGTLLLLAGAQGRHITGALFQVDDGQYI